MLNWRGPEPGPGPVVITMEVTEKDNLETYFIKLFDNNNNNNTTFV